MGNQQSVGADGVNSRDRSNTFDRSNVALAVELDLCHKRIEDRQVDLKGYQLKEIPSDIEIDMWKRLQEFSIDHNLLQSIPPSACVQWSSLTVLWLNNNHLSSLPVEFQSLVSLKSLSLSANDFEEFPTALLALTSLQSLFFASNRLQVVPDRISSMRSLMTVHFQYNRLRRLPAMPPFVSGLNLSGNRSLPSQCQRSFAGAADMERYMVMTVKWITFLMGTRDTNSLVSRLNRDVLRLIYRNLADTFPTTTSEAQRKKERKEAMVNMMTYAL